MCNEGTPVKDICIAFAIRYFKFQISDPNLVLSRFLFQLQFTIIVTVWKICNQSCYGPAETLVNSRHFDTEWVP